MAFGTIEPYLKPNLPLWCYILEPCGECIQVCDLSQPWRSNSEDYCPTGRKWARLALALWLSYNPGPLQFFLPQCFPLGRLVIRMRFHGSSITGYWPCLHRHVLIPAHVLCQTRRLRGANDPFWVKFVNLGIFFSSTSGQTVEQKSWKKQMTVSKALPSFVKSQFILCFSGWKIFPLEK